MQSTARQMALILVIALITAGCATGMMPTATDPPTPLVAVASLPPVSPAPTHTDNLEVPTISTDATNEAPGTALEPETTFEPRPDRLDGKACLIDSWSIVHESLVGYLNETFDQSGQITFEFQTGQGDLLLTFNQDGITTFRADNLELLVAIPGLAEFTFVVKGDGLAQYAAEEDWIATWGHVSAVSSEAPGDDTGADFVMVLTPEQVFLEGFTEDNPGTWADVPQDSRLTYYACKGDQLVLNVDGTLTSEWVRTTTP